MRNYINYKEPNYLGYPSFPIPGAILKVSLRLLVDGVYRLKNKYKFKPNDFEDQITKKLVFEMQDERDKKGYPIHVGIFSGTLNIDSPDKLSIVDIKFTWDNWSSQSYLAVQVKRLFGRGRSRADAYVKEGLLDFINGKYSIGHDYGIMLGYILLGPIIDAITAVENAMKKRENKTNEITPLNKVHGLINYSLLYESTHRQRDGKTKIIILHIFVDLAS